MTMNAVITPNAPTTYTLMGSVFEVDPAVPLGDFVADERTDPKRGFRMPIWRCSQETITEVKSRSNGIQQGIVTMLKERRRGGATVVAGVVQPGARRGVVQQRAQSNDLTDLATRAKALVVQIGTLLDAGDIPPGQMAEISQTYAALQAQHDAVLSQMAEIEVHLSMARGLVIEFATS